jgi:hypothetical protein
MPSKADLTDVAVYVFRASLVGFRGVTRKLAVREDETLADFHQLLQFAFDWDDDHLYAFWLSGKFGGRDAGPGFGRPGFCEDMGDRSARVRLDRLGLEVGQTVAYVFDFGDEWRVRLKLLEVRPPGVTPVPPILDSLAMRRPNTFLGDEDIA